MDAVDRVVAMSVVATLALLPQATSDGQWANLSRAAGNKTVNVQTVGGDRVQGHIRRLDATTITIGDSNGRRSAE